jgi:hypothetical protein
MGALTAVYFVIFLAGVGLAVAGWLLGHQGGSHHAQSHHAGSHSATGDGAHWFTPLLNLTALSAFACVGGGVGLLLDRLGVPGPISAICAAVLGASAAYAVGAFAAWLMRGTRYAAPLPDAIVGTVVSRIGPGTGEIVYLQHGARASLPARSVEGETFEPGSEVVVIEIRDGIARVERATKLLHKEI